MVNEIRCISTNDRLSNDKGAVIFPCPSCAHQVSRSRKARVVAMKYKCSKCGFEGPN